MKSTATSSFTFESFAGSSGHSQGKCTATEWGVSKPERQVLPETDALVTDLDTAVLGIFTADCLPALLLTKTKVFAVQCMRVAGFTAKILLAALNLTMQKWQLNAERVKVHRTAYPPLLLRSRPLKSQHSFRKIAWYQGAAKLF